MEIIVRGKAGEGKSTVALLIVEALQKAGISGTRNTYGDEELNPEFYHPEAQQKRITRLQETGLQVEISQEQEGQEKLT